MHTHGYVYNHRFFVIYIYIYTSYENNNKNKTMTINLTFDPGSRTQDPGSWILTYICMFQIMPCMGPGLGGLPGSGPQAQQGLGPDIPPDLGTARPAHMDPYGPHVGPYGTIWAHMGSYGLHMGPIWIHMNPYGPIWT